MKQNRRVIGGSYESKAAAFLQARGLKILEQNFRCRSGEVDLIARDGSYLVFVEVKYRSMDVSGSSLDAVDKRKQRMISKVAKYYLMTRCRSFDIPCRFDVVGYDQEKVYWIKNAFDCIGS